MIGIVMAALYPTGWNWQCFQGYQIPSSVSDFPTPEVDASDFGETVGRAGGHAARSFSLWRKSKDRIDCGVANRAGVWDHQKCDRISEILARGLGERIAGADAGERGLQPETIALNRELGNSKSDLSAFKDSRRL